MVFNVKISENYSPLRPYASIMESRKAAECQAAMSCRAISALWAVEHAGCVCQRDWGCTAYQESLHERWESNNILNWDSLSF